MKTVVRSLGLVTLIRVTNPGAATSTDYFLNSLTPPGNAADRVTYVVDYTAAIQAKGGASLRLLVSDPDCIMSKNCGPERTGSGLCNPWIPTNLEPAARTANPTVNFDFPVNGQWLVLAVKNVTSL